jgi:hypothetical protein
MRDRILSNVKYDLVINFTNQNDENPSFLGRVKISFNLKKDLDENEQVFLDFHGNGIYEFDVNGIKIPLE